MSRITINLFTQEFTPAVNYDPEQHSIEERRAYGSHSEYDEHSIEEGSAGGSHSEYSEHSIEKRSAGGSHSEYETIAQGLCMSMTIKNGQQGCTFAVRRRCYRNKETCSDLCTANKLVTKDQQYGRRKWRAIGAVHVYMPRPHSYKSTVTHPSIGLKALWHNDYQNKRGCGPNYCCCFVQLENVDAYWH